MPELMATYCHKFQATEIAINGNFGYNSYYMATNYQEYIIEGRESTAPVYPSVVRDMSFTMVWFVQCKQRLYKHTIIKVVSLLKAYYTLGYTGVGYSPSLLLYTLDTSYPIKFNGTGHHNLYIHLLTYPLNNDSIILTDDS